MVHISLWPICYWDVKKLTHSFELSLASLAPCVRKMCVFCVTDTLFTWAVLLIQCLFDSRNAPLSWLILTRAVAAPEWEFPGLLHSTSFILSACGCCMGKGSYRNTKYKYVIRRLGADVWFSLWFLWFSCVCSVFYSILSKNAGPTYVAGVD